MCSHSHRHNTHTHILPHPKDVKVSMLLGLKRLPSALHCRTLLREGGPGIGIPVVVLVLKDTPWQYGSLPAALPSSAGTHSACAGAALQKSSGAHGFCVSQMLSQPAESGRQIK